MPEKNNPQTLRTSPKISVICPVLLEEYPGSAPNRKAKFLRAVDSFLNQTWKQKELVVISDGCNESAFIVKNHYGKFLKAGIIKLVEITKPEKRELFVGAVRQKGIDIATGDILCNLDSDDTISPIHLHNIAVTFDISKYDWAYFGIYRKLDVLEGVEEFINTEPHLDSLCTASVAWRKGITASWNNCDGRMDNKAFNSQLLDSFPKKQKIYGCGYLVRHAVINHVSNK